MSRVEFPIMYIPDPTKGRPVFNGSVYFGLPDLDPTIPVNQQQVYYMQESGDLVAASQPISTSAGGVPTYNGSPVTLDISGEYSMTVLDKNLVQVYYIARTDSSGGDGNNIITYAEDPQILSSGQLVVDFIGITASRADIFIGKNGGDRGKLFNPDDYTVTGGSQITLTSSFNAGTKLIATSSEVAWLTEFVKKYNSLIDPVNDEGLIEGDAINLKERVLGGGGGAMWDVVLASGVTPNTFNIVQCIGVPTLALSLRIESELYSKQFGLMGDDSDETVGITAFRDYLEANKNIQLVFDEGRYMYTASPNWAIDKTVVTFVGDVTFHNTGTETSLVFDSGATALTFDFRFGWGNRVNVEGDAGSGGGVYIRSCHHCKIAVNVRGCGATFDAFKTEFSVLGEYDIVVSTNQKDTFTTIPLRGIVCDSRGAGETTSACTFYNPIIEGVSSDGIVLKDAIKNLFLGGTTEGNGGTNLVCEAESRINTFQGIDLEVAGVYGLEDSGRMNTFNDIFNDALAVITATAVNSTITGGQLDGITIIAGAKGTTLTDFAYGSVSGVIVDGGDLTTIRNAYFLTGARYFPTNKTQGANDFLDTVSAPFAWPVPAAVPGFSKRVGILVEGVMVGDNVVAAPLTIVPSDFIPTPSSVCVIDGQVDITFTQITGAAVSPLPTGSDFTISVNGA